MTVDGLDKFSSIGQALLNEQDAESAHIKYIDWTEKVSSWLSEQFPNSGLSAEWASQGTSKLLAQLQSAYSAPVWSTFHFTVNNRLRWLGDLPSKVSHMTFMSSLNQRNITNQTPKNSIKLQAPLGAYVNPARIKELKSIPKGNFDLAKLIRFCEELNICFAHECFLAMIVLTRAIIDHVPPVFGCKRFAEVSSNYTGGKSFKDSMKNLEDSSRNIADSYLHGQIRKAESLPNSTQVDFSNDLDLLLAEIARILK